MSYRASALVMLTMALLHATARAADDVSTDPGNWRGFGRTDGEQHFSPLSEINTATIGRLGLAWSFDLEAANAASGPVAVDGVVYTATGYSVLRAIDGKTGRQLWRYDPRAAEAAGDRLHLGWGSRGLAYLDGKVFTGTHDGRLIAVDAASGKPIWSVQTLQPGDSRYITGAPRAFAGKVIIGHGGSDSGPTRGYVTCYDANTGKQLWRFYLVPGDPAKGFENEAMAMAAKTWHGQWWKFGGGGGAWNAFTYDPELNLVYIGTGNGMPWNQKVRSPGGGDNLFLASIVALEADTGAYVWHYQVNPGESWDYNATMDMELATLVIGGAPRKVLMQAPKNGFFYVLDRATGKLISAEPLVKVTWASRIDLATGRPVENPNARYAKGSFGLSPSNLGAHSWEPMSFNPETSLVYLPVTELEAIVTDQGVDLKHWRLPTHNRMDGAMYWDLSQTLPNARSYLLAWNPVTQKAAWKIQTPSFLGGGTMTTAGKLVFQGHVDNTFNAYAADSGKLVWSFDAGAPVIAPPISYTVAGHQYVTVLAGLGTGASAVGAEMQKYKVNFNQPRRVLTFALDANAALPPAPAYEPVRAPADPSYQPLPDRVARGKILVFQRCLGCHGIDLIAAGAAPDLRGSAIVTDTVSFRAVVKDGALVPKGMPRFGDLSDEDVETMRQYVRSRQQDLRKQTVPRDRGSD